MNARMLRTTFIAGIALASWLVISPQAFAQGTATGPITAHVISGPPPEVFIGDAGAPIPIDLDPDGLPWTKEIYAPPGFTLPPGTVLSIHETIINVGTEDWWDWHEHVEPDAVGTIGGLWASPPKLMVDGALITFDFAGVGTPNLWMDNFSAPVEPGQILEVWKEIELLQIGVGDPTVPVLVLTEFPTPEPASVALLGAGGMFLLVRRRRRIG